MWMSGCRKDCPKACKSVTGQKENNWKKKDERQNKCVVTTLAEKLCPRTCMAAVNWASFSMVSSEAPLCTVIKTEFLKKYLQF